MARIARIKAEGEAFYHVVSRIANKAFLLNDDEKKHVFVNMMHRAADFSGVDVITYVVMDNHFHLCVRIPKREGEVSESEILRRVGVLYGEDRRAALENQLESRKGRLCKKGLSLLIPFSSTAIRRRHSRRRDTVTIRRGIRWDLRR